MKRRTHTRSGSINSFYLMVGGALCVLAVLAFLLARINQQAQKTAGDASVAGSKGLFLYCAAGMQQPIEKIVAEYGEEYGVPVQVQ